MEGQSVKQSKREKKAANNELLKLERPIYQLKRNEAGKVESMIAKLMIQQKQKPIMEPVPRSSLLSQLDSFLPLLKQSNNQLLQTEIKPEQKIDAKLEQVQDSSSQSQNQEEQMVDESSKMQQQKPSTEILQSCDQFQFNILTYPYLDQKPTNTESQKAEQKSKALPNVKKVVQIVQHSSVPNHLQQLE